MKITLIAALEKMAELNDTEIFVQDNAEEIRKSVEYIKKRLTKAKEEEFALIRNDNLSQAEQELKTLFSMIEEGYIIPELLSQEA